MAKKAATKTKTKAKPKVKVEAPTVESILKQVDAMVDDICHAGGEQQEAVDAIAKLRGKLYDKMSDMQDEIDEEDNDND